MILSFFSPVETVLRSRPCMLYTFNRAGKCRRTSLRMRKRNERKGLFRVHKKGQEERKSSMLVQNTWFLARQSVGQKRRSVNDITSWLLLSSTHLLLEATQDKARRQGSSMRHHVSQSIVRNLRSITNSLKISRNRSNLCSTSIVFACMRTTASLQIDVLSSPM